MRSYVRLSTKLRGRLGGGGGESGGGVPEDEVTDGDGLRSPATISSPRSLIWGPRSGLVPSPPIPASMIDMPLSPQALDSVLSAWALYSCQRSACRHMPMLRRERGRNCSAAGVPSPGLLHRSSLVVNWDSIAPLGGVMGIGSRCSLPFRSSTRDPAEVA